MPHKASEIVASRYMRLLVMGGPKAGKTHTVIATAPGPIYVINSDDKYGLTPAARVADFEWDLALGNSPQEIETCIVNARKGVKEGRYKTIVWDTLTKYAARIEEVYANATLNAKGDTDGRRYWPLYKKHLHSIIDRLFSLNAHVIVNAHYIESSSVLIDGQTGKSGTGIVPLLGGSARATIPAEFNDVVFLEKKPKGRFFVASAEGVFGPGCRSLPGVNEVEADVGKLWEAMNK